MRKTLMTVAAAALLGQPATAENTPADAHPYVGTWVTRDGNIRQRLLPNGRYVEARGARERAYEGRYAVSGTRIEYWDDTGFTADGTFVTADELSHGGMVFFRERGID
ncbi:MAG: hypothetical protein DI556_06135 [Rhodovulum sulfidophilum]|uniref:Ligand-binding protein with streptavidin-like fold n=1 Tax=Rhodovulum sulfidophilum TaxID=35806 RepID=A0A2W5NB23_RHOSU|nr:MAG: hypothetical protein DI556_06135 [Rhodovulum sulfidophilum]